MSGQYASTPLEALRLENGIESYGTTSKRLTAKAYEKARRLEENHPRYKALSNSAALHRTKRRSSWRQESEKINNSLPLADLEREPLPNSVQRPWTSNNNFEQWSTSTGLKEINMQGQSPAAIFSNHSNISPWNEVPQITTSNQNVETEAAIQTIDGYEKDTVIYTDGSCKDGTQNGGAAAVITTGSARCPIELEVLQKKGNKYTCSYDEEKAAMNIALDWMLENSRSSDAVICSDSQSLIFAIECRQSNVMDIISKLQQLKGRVIIQWVPGHSNIPGNEMADKYAKEIAQQGELTVSPSPLSYNTVRAIIRREIKDPPSKHPTVSKAYEHLSIKEEKKIETRKEAALLAQLRSGHCKGLKAYQHRMDESKDETCPRCQLEAETVQHWLACPATITKRQEIFGDDEVPLGTMTKQPGLILAYAKETLLQS